MFWRDPRIVKETSIWSTMFSMFMILALVWGIALTAIEDPTWRWATVGIGTIVCLILPGGLVCVFWLASPQYRKQYRLYRRGGPFPPYPQDQPWLGSPEITKSLQNYTDHYLSNNTILGSHSPEFQKGIRDEMYDSVTAIYNSDDPFAECRKRLAEYAVSFADWQVLCLTSEEQLQLSAGDIRCSPYISGKLHDFIQECSKYNDGLIEFITRTQQSADDELVMWSNARSCAFQYLMNCLNIIRADVNDLSNDNDDWFRPFVKSMLIWKEDDYRSKIGLQTLLPRYPTRLAWRHSAFLTSVLEGAHDPLAHWEKVHEVKHKDVS
jgi:hypothetical protein